MIIGIRSLSFLKRAMMGQCAKLTASARCTVAASGVFAGIVVTILYTYRQLGCIHGLPKAQPIQRHHERVKMRFRYSTGIPRYRNRAVVVPSINTVEAVSFQLLRRRGRAQKKTKVARLTLSSQGNPAQTRKVVRSITSLAKTCVFTWARACL